MERLLAQDDWARNLSRKIEQIEKKGMITGLNIKARCRHGSGLFAMYYAVGSGGVVVSVGGV